jgi:hypothetical protein
MGHLLIGFLYHVFALIHNIINYGKLYSGSQSLRNFALHKKNGYVKKVSVFTQ